MSEQDHTPLVEMKLELASSCSGQKLELAQEQKLGLTLGCCGFRVGVPTVRATVLWVLVDLEPLQLSRIFSRHAHLQHTLTGSTCRQTTVICVGEWQPKLD